MFRILRLVLMDKEDGDSPATLNIGVYFTQWSHSSQVTF